VFIYLCGQYDLKMPTAETRHRLTITVSAELFSTLRDVAGSRKISSWMEEAAWRRLHAERDLDLVGIGSFVDADEDRADLGASPKWSGLVD
jgi:hypothetical protein